MRTKSGRQAFLEILRAAGTSHIFGNPGTTELPLTASTQGGLQRPGPTLIDVPLASDFPAR